MSGMSDRWVAVVTVTDRSGSLSAMTECFSTRGVSFEAVSTLDIADGRGTVAFVFAGTERIARILARTLARLTDVSEVTLSSAQDPAVRAVAHGHLPVGADASVVEGLDGVGAALVDAGGSLLLTGALSSVERAISALRAAGATGLSLSILRPREPQSDIPPVDDEERS